MQDIERILTDADVKPTAIRMMVMKEIIAIGHTFTLSDMEIRLETVDRSTLFRTLTLVLRPLPQELDFRDRRRTLLYARHHGIQGG